MQRREMFALAGFAMAAKSATVLAQDSNDELHASLFHVFATASGESRVARVQISNDAGEVPVTGMTARAYARTVSSQAEWHTAPRSQFAINMTGSLEVEVSDGSRQIIGAGDLVFLSDVTGKGHVTRVLTPVTNIFLHVPPGWDMMSWARGLNP